MEEKGEQSRPTSRCSAVQGSSEALTKVTARPHMHLHALAHKCKWADDTIRTKSKKRNTKQLQNTISQNIKSFSLRSTSPHTPSGIRKTDNRERNKGGRKRGNFEIKVTLKKLCSHKQFNISYCDSPLTFT